MKHGAIMSFDAVFAAVVVLMLVVIWASVHGQVVRGAAERGGQEAAMARVIAAADWIVKENGHVMKEADVGDEKILKEVGERFGVTDASLSLDVYGGAKEMDATQAKTTQRFCAARAVVVEGKPAVLRVCGK